MFVAFLAFYNSLKIKLINIKNAEKIVFYSFFLINNILKIAVAVVFKMSSFTKIV